MDRHFGRNFKKGMQGSMNRQIGLNFEIEIHGPPWRAILVRILKRDAGILGPPNWSEF